MSSLEEKAFIALFRTAYEKCFNKALTHPLSETDSKHFSNEILEQTGLVIGWKTIKNYSFYALNHLTAKQENPSVATLDTFARYASDSPKTDEISRKRDEPHFPYWYAYRDGMSTTVNSAENLRVPSHPSASTRRLIGGALTLCLASVIGFFLVSSASSPENFTDRFSDVSSDSLSQKGWMVKDQDPVFWNKRDKTSGYLTLFTLEGDTYPDNANKAGIKNLMLKKINTECFSTEMHLRDFIPNQNWQQAGILLMEDTTLSSRSLRLTIAYNDFFGGYAKPGEVLIQAISSTNGGFSKPEEIAHVPLFSHGPGQETIMKNNLRQSALRIEKNGHRYRFLYATGATDLFAFKEVVSRDLVITPRYVAIFGLRGFVKESLNMPVYVDFFNIQSVDCED